MSVTRNAAAAVYAQLHGTALAPLDYAMHKDPETVVRPNGNSQPKPLNPTSSTRVVMSDAVALLLPHLPRQSLPPSLPIAIILESRDKRTHEDTRVRGPPEAHRVARGAGPHHPHADGVRT
jgi:hypothetical protein